MHTQKIDLLIIGGGINGSGIAHDAAGRGLKVILCEQNDLASATSNASSKLIHGGIRYLEHYEFKMVHHALKEREVLMRQAPFLITPLQFILPWSPKLRPRWLIRLGLFIYDHLARRQKIPGSKPLNLDTNAYGEPLKNNFNSGFSYYDCHTDDARLVILNCLAAKQHGARIMPHTRCVRTIRHDDYWDIELCSPSQKKLNIKAKAVINASGPWVNKTLTDVFTLNPQGQVQLVKGSHIVVKELFTGEHAYILQTNDQRVVFAIPYQNDFTLIGTTDESISNYEDSKTEASEIDYLCKVINHYFKKSISTNDVIWSYWGARALFDDGAKNPSAISREYHFELDKAQAPILSIYGGKLTSYRLLSEAALKYLKPWFTDMREAWTKTTSLPGSDFDGKNFADHSTEFKAQFNWLPENLINRYLKSYGCRCLEFLNGCQQLSDLGQHFGAGLYENEVNYLVKYEWAKTVEDIIWRRSKLGLHLKPDAIEQLKTHLELL